MVEIAGVHSVSSSFVHKCQDGFEPSGGLKMVCERLMADKTAPHAHGAARGMDHRSHGEFLRIRVGASDILWSEVVVAFSFGICTRGKGNPTYRRTNRPVGTAQD